MLRMILNVGKQTSERFGHPTYQIADTRIHSELQARGFTVRQYEVRESNTEPTAIVLVQDDEPFRALSVRERLHHLAVALHQDCVAAVPVVHGTTLAHIDHGVLIGPHADAWGAFDPQFFLQ